MKKQTPNQTDRIPAVTQAPALKPHPVEELFARHTGVRHQLGAGIPKNSPLAPPQAASGETKG
jgi:hypothetical protein